MVFYSNTIIIYPKNTQYIFSLNGTWMELGFSHILTDPTKRKSENVAELLLKSGRFKFTGFTSYFITIISPCFSQVIMI